MNISSITGYSANPVIGFYSAAKFGESSSPCVPMGPGIPIPPLHTISQITYPLILTNPL